VNHGANHSAEILFSARFGSLSKNAFYVSVNRLLRELLVDGFKCVTGSIMDPPPYFGQETSAEPVFVVSEYGEIGRQAPPPTGVINFVPFEPPTISNFVTPDEQNW
jgi:hypothetical protein